MAKKKKKDAYEVLGVDKSASKDQIDKAFRKKARKAHPDAGGSEKEFKELNECHALLISDERREKYDQFGDDEDTPSMPPMSLAMQVLSAVISMAIRKVIQDRMNVEKVDLVLIIKKLLQGKLDEAKEDIKGMKDIRSGFLKAKKRFKRKKKSDNEQDNTFMDDAINHHIEKIEAAIKIAEGSLNGTIDALKMTDDYIYEREKEPERSSYGRSFFDNSFFAEMPAYMRPGTWRGTPQDGSLKKTDEKE